MSRYFAEAEGDIRVKKKGQGSGCSLPSSIVE